MGHHSTAISLPGPIGTTLDRMLGEFLASPGLSMDFLTPAGEPALVPASSVSWTIFKNPVSLFIGGITAVLLEMAEPRVRDGVWDHSSFRTEPLKRLKRTGLAAMMTVYGPRSRAEVMIGHVVTRHGQVNGRTSEGQAYRANDPDLLDWVQATASYGFMEAYHSFVRPLSPGERDALLQEAQPAARLYGAVGAPASQAELNAQFERMKPTLVPSPIVFEFLGIMENVAALPLFARPLQKPMIKAAVHILPPWLRARLGLENSAWTLRPWEQWLVALAARTNDRLVMPSSPAVQSCRRLGLGDDYLYRRRQGDGRSLIPPARR